MPASPSEPRGDDAPADPAREVVVTGVGVVSPIGIGRDAFWTSLVDQRSGVRRVTGFDISTSRCQFAGEVVDFEGKKYVRPRKSLKVMSRDIQLGFAAAELAVDDSGLNPEDVDPDRKAVIFAADLIYAGVDELEDAFRSCLVDGEFDFDLWGVNALANMYPLWMLKHLPNMPACHIGIAQDARGPNNSLTIGEVSSLQALAEAASVIQRGRADVVISGGATCQINATVYDFRGRGRFTHWQGDPTEACRPFDADRDGMIHGEGAAAYVLETRDHAERRNANVLGQLCGFSSRFEPTKNGQPFTGSAIRSSIRASLAAAGLRPEQIGHVNAHGVSTIDDDRNEAQAIRDTLGDVPVTGLKSYFGNLGAASGAVEMAGSVLGLQAGTIPATLNYQTPDPQCPVNVVHGESLATEKQAALLLNQGRAGQAVAAVFVKN